MTISIYRKNSLSKNLMLRLGGGYPPPSVLKGFLWGPAEKKRGLAFLLGYFKDTVQRYSLDGEDYIRGRLITTCATTIL